MIINGISDNPAAQTFQQKMLEKALKQLNSSILLERQIHIRLNTLATWQMNDRCPLPDPEYIPSCPTWGEKIPFTYTEKSPPLSSETKEQMKRVREAFF
jgi:hypothetical protein